MLDALICGAGPTGMVLALELALRGARIRLIDRSPGPGTASRAIIVHARTLELYRRLGLAEEIVGHGIKVARFHLREGRHEAASIPVGDFGRGLSPYPFVLSLPQDEHEKILERHLEKAGIRVEWNASLVRFAEAGDHVRAVVHAGGCDEAIESAYLCGCDGAHSTVREGLGLTFPGGTYEQLFYVTDVEARGIATDGDMHLSLGSDIFCVVFPIRTTGRFRLIGIVPEELASKPTVTLDDVRPFVERLLGIEVGDEKWFSTYQVHHRVAEHFRKGRVFIAGDAGHVHSPAGGQGMNTGIGDAINLAWKIAAVTSGRASDRILDTYEPERIQFARTLVATTDRAFKNVVNRRAAGRFVRKVLFPHIVPRVVRFPAVRRLAFRTLSQTRIHYRESPLSDGRAGGVHGGDRLPWVERTDNYAPLVSLDWQIQLYGAAEPSFVADANAGGVRVHAFPWNADAERAGLAQGAVYLVRPDGYVALAHATQEFAAVRSFLERFGVGARAAR